MTLEFGILMATLAALVGVGFGLFATWAAIHNARNAEERVVITRVAVIMWAGLFLLLVPFTIVAVGFAPQWVFFAFVGLYAVGIAPFLIWSNAQMRRARSSAGGGQRSDAG